MMHWYRAEVNCTPAGYEWDPNDWEPARHWPDGIPANIPAIFPSRIDAQAVIDKSAITHRPPVFRFRITEIRCSAQ